MEETKLLDECDVVVPVTKIASYLEFVNKTGEECGLVIRSFGHAGDGNASYLWKWLPMTFTEEEFKKRVDKFFDLIYKEGRPHRADLFPVNMVSAPVRSSIW